MPYKYHGTPDRDGNRECRLCFQIKPLEQFYLARGLYRFRKCKACVLAEQKEYTTKNKEACRLANAAGNLRRTYGITPEEVARLAAEQGWMCAICRRTVYRTHSRIKPDSLNVDHNHATGRIRGILCFNCNTGIAKLGESADLLRRAAEYLEQEPPVVISRSKQLSKEERIATRSKAAIRGWNLRQKK